MTVVSGKKKDPQFIVAYHISFMTCLVVMVFMVVMVAMVAMLKACSVSCFHLVSYDAFIHSFENIQHILTFNNKKRGTCMYIATF